MLSLSVHFVLPWSFCWFTSSFRGNFCPPFSDHGRFDPFHFYRRSLFPHTYHFCLFYLISKIISWWFYFANLFSKCLLFVPLFLSHLHISLLTMKTSLITHFLILTEQAPPSEYFLCVLPLIFLLKYCMSVMPKDMYRINIALFLHFSQFFTWPFFVLFVCEIPCRRSKKCKQKQRERLLKQRNV